MLALRAAYAPWILHAGDTADWSSWQVPRRRLAEYLLVAVLAGDGFVVVGKQRLRVRPGQARPTSCPPAPWPTLARQVATIRRG